MCKSYLLKEKGGGEGREGREEGTYKERDERQREGGRKKWQDCEK